MALDRKSGQTDHCGEEGHGSQVAEARETDITSYQWPAEAKVAAEVIDFALRKMETDRQAHDAKGETFSEAVQTGLDDTWTTAGSRR